MLLVKDVLPAWISYTLQNGNTLFFIKSVFPSSTASMLSLGFYSKKSPWEEKNVGKSMWSPASLKTEIKMALKKRNGLEKDVIFVLKIKFIDMAYKKKLFSRWFEHLRYYSFSLSSWLFFAHLPSTWDPCLVPHTETKLDLKNALPSESFYCNWWEST